MMASCLRIACALCVAPWAFGAWAQEKAAAGDAAVEIKFDDPAPREGEEGRFPYAPPLEQLFQNPAFAGGLASGADAINRSVDSLMDSLFYSLLDSEWNFDVTDETWFHTGLRRDVYSAPSGAYVVMDRFQLGPRYAKELWRVHDIPVNLGIDGTVEVLQIYLRTDGMRIAEQAELSPFRRWVNSWFGLLPLFAKVLPPSFNQNELYDPLKQLETPFSFPLDVDAFYAMPVGSIRSYAISGGVQVAVDFAGTLDQMSKDALHRIGEIQATLPYTVFRRGEHRINVLRRDEDSAWVGVKDARRFGHAIAPFSGNRYFILRGALAASLFDWDWIWTGVPISVLPVDLNFEQAIADLFDQVYEFDLTNPVAQEAYVAAVKGDFVPARLRYLDAKEKGLETGVTFHFSRNQDRNELVSRNGPNIAIYRRERQRDHGEAEIEITDQDGKFYILESSLDVVDKSWDVLVGEEEQRMQQTVEMRVRRVIPKDDPENEDAYTYAFEADLDPYRMTLALNIRDGYLDTVEYYQYLEDLRAFTGLRLGGVPRLPLRDPELLASRRKRAFYEEPTDQILSLHVTPTYLGQFGAQAILSFSAKQIDRIIASPEDEIWAAFAKAYEMDPEAWRDSEVRASFTHQMRWFGSFLLYPSRLLNMRFAKADAIKEATAAVKQIMALKTREEPLERLEAFYNLLDTDYPLRLGRALLELADLGEVPRRVSFSAQPKGSARHEIKAEYGRLNNRVFKAGPPLLPLGRYAAAKQKLANFYLDQPREVGARPMIQGIVVKARPIPASVRAVDAGDGGAGRGGVDRDARHVFVTLRAKGVEPDREAKVYVRVEQAGRIKIGKLELAEKVLDLSGTAAVIDGQAVVVYQFYLTGPLSPLSTYFFEQAVGEGDDFLVTLALSPDGTNWSDERALEFRFEKGRLMPAQ